MDTSTAFEFAQFTRKHSDDYIMVMMMRKRVDAEGTSVMMSGRPDELMGCFAQMIASFYKRYRDVIKEGIDVKEICDDIAMGAQMTLDKWDADSSQVADMTDLAS